MANVGSNFIFLKKIIEICLNEYLNPSKVEVLSVDCHDRLDLPGATYEMRIIYKHKRDEKQNDE